MEDKTVKVIVSVGKLNDEDRWVTVNPYESVLNMVPENWQYHIFTLTETDGKLIDQYGQVWHKSVWDIDDVYSLDDGYSFDRCMTEYAHWSPEAVNAISQPSVSLTHCISTLYEITGEYALTKKYHDGEFDWRNIDHFVWCARPSRHCKTDEVVRRANEMKNLSKRLGVLIDELGGDYILGYRVRTEGEAGVTVISLDRRAVYHVVDDAEAVRANKAVRALIITAGGEEKLRENLMGFATFHSVANLHLGDGYYSVAASYDSRGDIDVTLTDNVMRPRITFKI